MGIDQPSMPDHQLCGVCHEIDMDATETSSCMLCHTREDLATDPIGRFLDFEQKFSHEPHVARGIGCTTCHEDPEKRPLPRGPLMSFCTDCHEREQATIAVSSNITDCATCHNEMTTQTPPTSRGGFRISHDVPGAWERAHGHEFQMSPEFCFYCHEEQGAFCEDCHRKTAPSTHTISWRRKTHGLQAGWDRTRCAVCHEEDSCIKCHRSSEPTSHRRGGWGSPGDRHCMSCHYPEEATNCTVCHETIEHRDAPRSVHARGLFPANCAACHPANNPFRAPHPLNNTAACTECHR